MKRSLKKNIVFFYVIFLNGFSLHCIGQEAVDSIAIKESFIYLKDEQIKKEIACFNLKSQLLGERIIDTTGTVLTQISISSSSSKTVHFVDATFFKSRGCYIHLYFRQFDANKHRLVYDIQHEILLSIDNYPVWGTKTLPQTQVDSIFFIVHSHAWIKVPRSAYIGLYEPNFCVIEGESAKRKSHTDEFCFYTRMYESGDKTRSYIYMIGGKGSDRYEVTWIFQNKYYGRVIDAIPE